VHSVAIEVGPSAIDENRHVNNTAFVRWMQEVAIEHTSTCGWPMSRYFEAGATWVVRSHYVEYLHPAFEGDALRVATWVAGMDSPRSTRRYVFWRDGDNRPVVRAETLWVFVGLETGRPRTIPEDLASAFILVPDEMTVYDELGLSFRRPPGRGTQ
jgi:acyl-CoA thioester hydrolase